MIGGFAYHRGFLDIQPGGILKKGLGVKSGDFQDAFPPFPGAFYHFIVAFVIIPGKVPHIGDVHDMGYAETGAAQGPDQNIMDHIGPEVSNVGIIIHSGPAAVKTDLIPVDRLEDLQFPAQGII
jgi:hypothetical protein